MLLIIWPFWTLWRGTFGGYTSHDHPWEEAYTRDFADPPPRCLRLSFEVCGAERDTGGGEIAKVCVCPTGRRKERRSTPSWRHLHPSSWCLPDTMCGSRGRNSPGRYDEDFSFVSPVVKYLLFLFNFLFWVSLLVSEYVGWGDIRTSKLQGDWRKECWS